MRVEWLNEARNEFLAFLKFYKTEVGIPYAKKFAEKILHATEQLADFPELGVLKYDTLMGKHGFRALFIDQYVCIYKIEMDTVYIYHLQMPERITCIIFLEWNRRLHIQNAVHRTLHHSNLIILSQIIGGRLPAAVWLFFFVGWFGDV